METLTTQADPLIEPLSVLSAELVDMANRLQSVRTAHVASIEAAAAQLQISLREQITESLQQRLDADFQKAVQVIRAEFDERLRTAEAAWAEERQSLSKEIEHLRRSGDTRELSVEIAQAETALIQLRSTIGEMLDDPHIEISKLLRARTRETELQTYIRGLQFKANQARTMTETKDEKLKTEVKALTTSY